ncbi:MAG: glucosyl-3-phosphoglycerate synthase [Solirubrobacteraceae bacterium]|nr:glucosyl-3-phosphoglycerate synthase [Solirubrobacteraceae bacterium]
MIATFHHSRYELARGPETVSVVVPTRQCAETIGPIAAALADLRSRGFVEQVLVVDADSADGTASIARAAGADVVSENALMPAYGPARGKGDAMWRALSVCTGDIVCFLDGDSGHFGEHFVAGTVGPLLGDPGVQFVKAFFRRPFRTPAGEMPDGGGRVTELTARPLLRRYWPELAGMRQPLAGEMAARRELLWRLPFSTGYAVETALLLDVYRECGVRGLAQVDLDVRQNDHKTLRDLAPMADEVLAAASVRLARDGRLTGDVAGPVERPPMREVLAAAA